MFAIYTHGEVMCWPGGRVEQEQGGKPEGPKTNYSQHTDAAGCNETRPKNIALLPCIRFR